MATFISASPEATLAWGERWGHTLTRGAVIGLSGELGAGKTQLVKGLARGLGVTDRIHSPTFTLVHEYRSGRLPLFHLDLYRLDSVAQIVAAGLEEYLVQPPGIAVVEWIEKWCPWPPTRSASPSTLGGGVGQYHWVRIEMVDNQQRRLVYEDPGA